MKAKSWQYSLPSAVALLAMAVWLTACQPLPEVADTPPKVERGYSPRACGFDLDDNGILGEPQDCRLCDGLTTDPDGDGVAEDLIYVDCDGGQDQATCGSAAAPCASLAFAWAERADGAEDGAEDILCFRGLCKPEDLTPSVGGVEGRKIWPRSGSQDRDFELPRDPAMLVGWDHDGDGEYPPYDGDDVSVLDGAGLFLAFNLGERNSRFEMAHFEVRDYGRFSDSKTGGFVRFGYRGGRHAELMYFHDLSLQHINMDQPVTSDRIVFNYFTSGTRLHHLAFVNLEVLDVSGFMVRGSGPERPGLGIDGRDDGPLRWQNLTVTAHGCDHSDPACRQGGGSAFIGWKMWGYLSGVEVLDSVFDANVAAWEPKPEGNGGALLVNATQCSRGWTVRNNEIRDFKIAFKAQGGNGGYCDHDRTNEPPRSVPRPSGDMVFDRNRVLNTYQPWRSGDYLVHLKGGDDAQRTLDSAVISDNFLASTDGFDACIFVDVSNDHEPAPGSIQIFGNTCWGSRSEGHAYGLQIGHPRAAEYPLHNILLRNNVFAGLDEEDDNFRLYYRPQAWRVSGNVFDPQAGFQWQGRQVGDLSGLEQAIGTSLESAICETRLQDPAAGDLHLHADDVCAANAGSNLTFWRQTDIDGDARPDGGPWDAGADQRRLAQEPRQ